MPKTQHDRCSENPCDKYKEEQKKDIAEYLKKYALFREVCREQEPELSPLEQVLLFKAARR